MSKEEITDVINKLNNPKNFNYYTNYGYAISLLISDADTILEYIENLQQRIDKAIEYIEKNIHFCENDSQGAYDVCNIRIASDKKLLEILKGDNND